MLWFLDSLLETVYPESCVLCGSRPHHSLWCAQGSTVKGLRPWDKPHLCFRCLSGLESPAPISQHRRLGDGSFLRYIGAGRTTAELTRVVGAWKYHGLRGLVWPLAGILSAASAPLELIGALVPVPLHRRRRRERGFNQAAVLANLLSLQLGIPVAADLALRVRNTGQQARLTTVAERYANMRGTFAVKSPARGQNRSLILVDDLVTSGATTGELALSLKREGWLPIQVLAVGLGRDPADNEIEAQPGMPAG